MSEPRDWQRWLVEQAAAMVLLARQHTGNHADAQDVVQEAVIRFWPRRAEASDPPAFLAACVRNGAIDFARRRSRRRARESAARIAAEPMLESPLEQNERRDAIEAALTHLPPEQREVVVMKVWAGLTFRQIAEALDIPANTAASRYRYALEALKKQLDGEAIR